MIINKTYNKTMGSAVCTLTAVAHEICWYFYTILTVLMSYLVKNKTSI